MRNVGKLLLFILFLGCNMAPKLKMPKIETPKEYQSTKSIFSVDSLQIKYWWKQFNNEGLNQYISLVLKNNIDLKLAIERVKQFEAISDISTAPMYPQLDANGSVSDVEQHIINNFTPTGDYIPIKNKQYNVGLTFTYALDFWGKFRNMSNAAVADWKAMRHELNDFYHQLIVQTITSYFEIASLKKQVDFASQVMASYENDFRVQRDKYLSGLAPRLNMDLTKEALSFSRTNYEGLKEQLDKGYFQFSLLLGTYPSTDFSTNLSASMIEKVPHALPSELVEQRADIQAALEQVEAARLRVGVARADFFPQFNLSANISWGVKSVADLLDPDLINKTITGAISQSVFNGFSKSGTLEKNWSEYRQSLLNYHKKILQSFQEVESSLVEVNSIEKQFRHTQETRDARKNIYRMQQKQYMSGLSTYQDLLSSKRANFDSERSLIQMRKNFILSRVKLFRVLGGTWM